MIEADWQRQVIDLARLYGFRVAHFRPAKTDRGWRTPVQADGAGFPDLVLVRDLPPDLLVAELKAAKGRVSGEQQAWLDAFTAAGVDAYVWRPGDFDAVNERLARGRVQARVA